MLKTSFKQLCILNSNILALFSVSVYLAYAGFGILANTFVSLIFNICFFLILILSSKNAIFSRVNFVHLYVMWIVISCIRGVYVAEIYWDWKALSLNTFALLMPLASFISFDLKLVSSIIKTYLKYFLFLLIPLYFLINPTAYGFYLIPVSFLALFFPILKSTEKLLIISIVLLLIFSDLGARSTILKFIIPLIFSIFYYFRNMKVPFNTVKNCMYILPLILFILAYAEKFNIFNPSKYIENEYIIENKKSSTGESRDENLLADTRTFLYQEVLYTANYYDSWWIGRSPARGNISNHFGSEDPSGRGERIGNEAAILNIFTWTGLIGVILYLLCFYFASSLAIMNSHNIFAKILGLYISFRWCYAWVEDINKFDINMLYLWITIGLCYSKQFRSMSNNEVKTWVHSFFNYSYFKRKKNVFKNSFNLL